MWKCPVGFWLLLPGQKGSGIAPPPHLWVKLPSVLISVCGDQGVGENSAAAREVLRWAAGTGLECSCLHIAQPDEDFSSGLMTSMLCPWGARNSKLASETQKLNF